ncbi:MAG TPA: hypothetical protein PLH57_07075, partial [Oligoflexia bacterium]|nr:hypothetical protein [Oligoflexia bacterium]
MQVNVDINQKKIKPAAKLLSRVPEPVIQSCRKLQGAGHIAWLAGGCVRDLILGREPRDWDVVTDAPLDTIKTIFPKHLDVGVVFGIVKLPPIQNVQIDIAIFRKEEGYTDRRHPDVVTTGSPAEDAARRDFTINALYLDLATSEMIDFFTGAKDLDAKILRSVGDPNKRFSEDALRVLRAVRLS